eukprot:TRINITY_DN104703_c0_g1_i1.p1 TRINITY_DN104703_c0_g1~~TRINITY_DN104703_c0_g1_i1.p1  ORF type:complete len:125 (+),score=6.05 TRINITY_DN104703_c0_g1_i1:45-377(+)
MEQQHELTAKEATEGSDKATEGNCWKKDEPPLVIPDEVKRLVTIIAWCKERWWGSVDDKNESDGCCGGLWWKRYFPAFGSWVEGRESLGSIGSKNRLGNSIPYAFAKHRR